MHFPPNIEQGIQHFASRQHIGYDEALVRLVETGLTAMKPTAAALHDASITEQPMSDQDAAMMDEIVAEAMEARRQRWERYLRD